jgi:hypothetical protein
MKLTKTKLKQIIIEETESALKELTVGGIPHLESKEKPEEEEEEKEEEYTKLRSVYGQKDPEYGHPLSPSQVVHRSAQTVRGKKK